MKPLTYMVLLCIGLFLNPTFGQDIENVSAKKPVKVSGFINMGSSYIDDNRANFFQKPLGYFGTLGMNVSIFESIQIPLSFTYSDQQTTFSRPSFRTFGLSPTYKWLTIHAGYRNFSVSPLLLSGSMIKGFGVEVKPGIFQVSLFKGDFNHEYNFGYNYNIISENDIQVYRRKVLGGKVAIGKGDTYFNVGMIKIQDDTNSGDVLALDTLSIFPQENFGLSSSGGFRLFNKVSFEANLAGSVLNSDIDSDPISADKLLEQISKPFINLNESTRVALAYDGLIRLQLGRTSLGFKYRHVDPGYETLGYVFLQQDINDYTFFFNTSLLRSTLILNGNVGFQYSNTKDYFTQQNARAIYNGSISWTMTPSLNWTGTYNNYNSEGNLSITEIVDSLQITTNNTGLSNAVNYRFGPKDNKHTINVNHSMNSFQLLRAGIPTSKNTSSNLSLSYSLRNKPSGITIGMAVKNLSFTGEEMASINRKGVSLRFKKEFSKKFSIGFRPSFDLNFTNEVKDGHVLNLKARTMYRISPKSSFNFIVNYRNRKTEITNPFSQFRISTSFNSRF